jgi:Mg-chelatase subunit ChlI
VVPISVPEIDSASPAELLNINDIYAKAGLDDTSKSIIKVRELKAALPNALSADIAKQTLAGIMTASGLDKDVVIADATARIAALNGAAEVVAKDTLSTITASEIEIADYEAKIDAAKEVINSKKKIPGRTGNRYHC